MKSFQVITYPAKILFQKASPSVIDTDLPQVVLRMMQTMKEYQGIGLAAPQIGIAEQLIIIQGPKKALAFLNPRIVKKSKQTSQKEEGCLSLPDLFISVKRAREVDIVATTPEGKEIRIHAMGLTARIFQHELDHLKGKLIISRMLPWKRFKLRKKLQEIRHGSL